MKVSCKTHGVHFGNEFEATLKCDFWKDRGLEKLKKDDKKQIWDWMFSFPFDEFATRTGKSLAIEWWGQDYSGNEFEAVFEDYKNLSDEERQDFQKKYNQWLYTLNQSMTGKILLNYFAEAIWKDVIKSKQASLESKK